MSALWTQEEAINFECARETITHLIAMVTADLAKEETKATPDASLVQQYDRRRLELALERENLSVSHHDDIERIFAVYGKMIREHQSGLGLLAA